MTKKTLENNNKTIKTWQALLVEEEKNLNTSLVTINKEALSPPEQKLNQLTNQLLTSIMQKKEQVNDAKIFFEQTIISPQINDLCNQILALLVEMGDDKDAQSVYYLYDFLINLLHFNFNNLEKNYLSAKSKNVDVSHYGLYVIYVARYLISLTNLDFSEKLHRLYYLFSFSKQRIDIFSGNQKQILALMLNEFNRKNNRKKISLKELAAGDALMALSAGTEQPLNSSKPESNATQESVNYKQKFDDIQKQLNDIIKNNKFSRQNNDGNIITHFKNNIIPKQIDTLFDEMYAVILSMKSPLIELSTYFEYKFSITALSFNFEKIEIVYDDAVNHGVDVLDYGQAIVAAARNLVANTKELNVKEKFALMKELVNFSSSHKPIFSKESLNELTSLMTLLEGQKEGFIQKKQSNNQSNHAGTTRKDRILALQLKREIEFEKQFPSAEESMRNKEKYMEERDQIKAMTKRQRNATEKLDSTIINSSSTFLSNKKRNTAGNGVMLTSKEEIPSRIASM
jgi:hypothetical protein